MADVLNHGGDGGDEPPHQHANRLQADCQTDGRMFQRNKKPVLRAAYTNFSTSIQDVTRRLIRSSLLTVSKIQRPDDIVSTRPMKKWWRNGKSKRSKLAPAAWHLTSTTLFLRSWGERRGHRRVVGRVLRGTSHSSTTRLRDQHSTSQSTEANNALKSKMETYMHQMNEFITLLTSNLQSVMPEIQLPTPPPPPLLSLMHEEELDSSNDDDYLSDF
ncbi:hypothetical protein Adt_45647 [Abeliophyllum distichum]|uniref:Uncharacterized protein n=1 Tax=Abeliophyllum distichum TaxID=126358 RepID=A0ABD1PE98_9LAMI